MWPKAHKAASGSGCSLPAWHLQPSLYKAMGGFLATRLMGPILKTFSGITTSSPAGPGGCMISLHPPSWSPQATPPSWLALMHKAPVAPACTPPWHRLLLHVAGPFHPFQENAYSLSPPPGLLLGFPRKAGVSSSVPFQDCVFSYSGPSPRCCLSFFWCLAVQLD